MSQNGQKTTSLMTSLTKNTKPKVTKSFFSLQTRKLTKSFEGLNSFLAQLTGELWSCKLAWK